MIAVSFITVFAAVWGLMLLALLIGDESYSRRETFWLAFEAGKVAFMVAAICEVITNIAAL